MLLLWINNVVVAGSEVVVVKNGRRICGTGAALANVPIVQNKAYFEVKLQCTGKSCVEVHCLPVTTGHSKSTTNSHIFKDKLAD